MNFVKHCFEQTLNHLRFLVNSANVIALFSPQIPGLRY